MSMFWHLALTGVSVLLALYVHRSLWKGVRARDGRAVEVPPTAFWSLSVSLLGIAVSGFLSLPAGALNLNTLPDHSVALLIAASGLLGVRFCMRAGMDACAFLASAVLLAGLLLGLSTGWLWASVVAVVSGLYLLRITVSLTQIVLDNTAALSPANGKIAGNANSRDEAYSHSR